MPRQAQLTPKQSRVIDMIVDECKNYQEIADILGCCRQNVYAMASKKRMSEEIAKRRALKAKYLENNIKAEAERVGEVRKKCLLRLERNIDGDNDMVANRAIEIFLRWIGEIDSGLNVTIKNEIPLPDRIEAAKQHWDNRLKVDGN